MARLALAEAELAVIAEAIREAIAAELLAPGSRVLAHELLDRIAASCPPRSTTTRSAR
jgi:hypothetical protein